MTPDRDLHARQRLNARRRKTQRQNAHPLHLLLRPLVAAAAILMIAMPANAQLSGSVTGEASASLPEAEIPDLPDASAHAEVRQGLRIASPSPEIDIEGHVYQVVSYADLVAAQAGQQRLCGSVDASGSIDGPAQAGLASYSEVCDHLDAHALYTDARGDIQAVQLPDTSWVTMPELHQQVSLDIQAEANTGFAQEAVGKLKAAGQATAEGAKSFASSMKAGFRASVEFFGGLF